MELLVGMGLASVAMLVMLLLTVFFARSFAALVNYVSLDQDSRNALDRMSKEIRQANNLVSAGTNYLSFSTDNGTLLYSYDPVAQTLTRSLNGVADPRPLLQGCQYLNFSIYQRTPVGGSYEQYPAADAPTCKLVQLSWICARPILHTRQNTESVQSAKVVLRRE
jgi:hypothetical protein